MTAPTRTEAGWRKRRRRRRAAQVAILLALAAALAAGYARVQGAAGPGGSSASGSSASGQSSPTASAQPSCGVTAGLVPTCGAWWGMYVPAASDSELTSAVSAQESYLGRRLDIIERYHDMSLSSDGIFPDPAEKQLARNHLLLFSWAPRIWSPRTKLQWSDVAAGAYDRTVVIPEARRLQAFGQPVFLSFASEPDGVTGQGTAAQYVAAWRHVHDVFTRLGVRNVIWVWTTEGYLPHAADIAAMYPGDAYVDWIGYDPYNFYLCHRASWQSFAQLVGPFYRWLTSRGLTKPIMLAEFSTAPDPGNPQRQADWYRSVVPTLQQYPRIKAVIQWNSPTRGCQLQLVHGTAAGQAYRQAGLSPYVNQELP